MKEYMTAITSNTIRGIVNKVNELQINKDKIVSLLNHNGQFILVYYTK